MAGIGGTLLRFPGGSGGLERLPTFRALADEWLETEGARLVCPDNERRHLEHLRPLWRLTEPELRPRQVKEVLASLAQPHGPLGPSTLNKVRGTGRRIIREAQINDRWSGPNPFEVVRRLKEVKPTHRTLSLEEARAVLPLLREDRRREALVMLYLGLRPGEVKALQRRDVDFSAAILTVRRSNGRDTTKTGKVRTIPLSPALRSILRGAVAASPPGCPLVFPDAAGERVSAGAKLSRALQSALREAGLVSGHRYLCRRKGCGHREERREAADLRCPSCGMKLWRVGVPLSVRWYDLRHSAATLHREAGCDPLVIQLVMGHAAENLTDSIYTHLRPEYVRHELSRLSI